MKTKLRSKLVAISAVCALVIISSGVLGGFLKYSEPAPNDVSIKEWQTWRPEKGMDWFFIVLRRTHNDISDINRDGIVNCIDYAITFKLAWDSFPDKAPYNCEIVRNVNTKTGMNHLFIRCRYGEYSDWLYIEPQGGTQNYRMEQYWQDKYDRMYNIFGETEKWLKSVRYKNR